MKQKPKSKSEPRTINARAWYYVNGASVDLIAEQAGGRPYVTTTTTRLTRKMLLAMLAELPIRKG